MTEPLPDIASSVSATEARALQQIAFGAVVLEVGSWRGFSTVAMAQVAKLVHAVDWHLGDEHAGHDESLGPLIENLDRYDVRDRVVAHVGRSADVLPLFRPASFDVAFIDAFHETAAVLEDAELVLPLLRRDGVIAFHDYGRFGVATAVDELAERGARWVDLIETLAILRVEEQ